MTEWYLTNFERGSRGNKLAYGKRELKIKIKDAEWVAGRLAMKKDNSWNIIQIEQTGTKNNPWKDKVVFEMLKIQNGKIIPLPPGEYMVKVSAQRGTGITSVEDIFYIS